MAGERPPLNSLTAENTGPTVIVVSYILVSISVVVTIIRFSLSVERKILFGLDDTAYVLANLWAIASSVLWHLAAKAGLGQHINDFEYAASFAEIVAMVFAKGAFMLLSDRIVPRDPKIKMFTFGAIGAWGIFSLFVIAFQCPLPEPWVFQPAQCPTHGNLFYAIISFNALTDVLLASMIIPVVWDLRMEIRDRTLVAILFGLRAIILAPALTELIMMPTFLGTSDQTRITVARAVLSQITTYVSVLSAAIPRTNQFLQRLHTDRSNALALPEFEIYNAGQMSEPKHEEAPQPPAQNNSAPSIGTADNSQSSRKKRSSLLAWANHNTRRSNRQEHK
ncbi:hypothetical protein BT63DRAFT_452085 [Microthyrium microscopicum]|uniref:Rhodopsin domain-containing protein n=1 Tax=Microthyrium microscopicum TaxID=703497 RepID=A0A6A6UJ67_9PEZI|nr:hypothetical protein BT63DRAFT_452085 [Microthyrium microscopicum]